LTVFQIRSCNYWTIHWQTNS